jgi:FAD:protein FMN transferase
MDATREGEPFRGDGPRRCPSRGVSVHGAAGEAEPPGTGPPGIEPPASRRPNRREFLAVGAGAFLVAAVPLLGSRRPSRLVRRRIPVMGTVAEVGVVHRDARHAHAAIDAAFRELRWVERTMSRFRPDSDVWRVNAAAGSDPVAVGEATARVVAEGLRWAEASAGAFDPSIGRAVALWDVGRRREPPSPAAVRSLAGRGLYRSVEVDRWKGRTVVRLGVAEAALDLGGIAKGYGVDRAVAALRSWGIGRGLVNVGGDLYALGQAPEGGAWQVGIRDPDDPEGVTGTLAVEDAAVATSGDYEEFFMHGGERFHHLLDPSTGAPRRVVHRSVTAVADDCMSADAAATTAFGTGRRRGAAIAGTLVPGSRIVALGGRAV